jgi:hypothetical protein
VFVKRKRGRHVRPDPIMIYLSGFGRHVWQGHGFGLHGCTRFHEELAEVWNVTSLSEELREVTIYRVMITN